MGSDHSVPDLGQGWAVIIGVRELKGTTRLRAIEHDVHAILDELQHKSPTVATFILTDFKIKRGGKAIQVKQPSKSNIKEALQQACRRRGKGVIFYLGHGYRSEGVQTSYWPTCDGKHIFGREFISWLTTSKESTTDITLVIDACSSASFIRLPIVYDGSGSETLIADPIEIPTSFGDGQLVVVAAAQFDQKTNTIQLNEAWRGLMLYLLIKKCKTGSHVTASEIAAFMRCEIGKGTMFEQTPHIAARRRLGDNPVIIF